MTAETLADQWIPIRQGTDSAFLLAVANVLFKENLYNTTFVAKFVEPTGFQNFQNYVLGQSPGPDGAIDRTPQWAEPICGIPAATIQSFAELYAKSQPCFWSTGTHVINKQPGAFNTARILMTLAAMTGNIGVLGRNGWRRRMALRSRNARRIPCISDNCSSTKLRPNGCTFRHPADFPISICCPVCTLGISLMPCCKRNRLHNGEITQHVPQQHRRQPDWPRSKCSHGHLGWHTRKLVRRGT